MKSLFMKVLLVSIFIICSILFCSCEPTVKNTSDSRIQKEQETLLMESIQQVSLPAIQNFQEKKMLKMLYELRDQENIICYVYLFNEREGRIGQYLGRSVGYGLPASTQFSNPSKLVDAAKMGVISNMSSYDARIRVIPQAEPNGLFMPEGLSATWIMLIDPQTDKPRAVYIEPLIIVSPFKLH